MIRKMIYTFIIAFISLNATAQAKSVRLPFYNEPIVEEGLTFHYDLTTNGNQRIICQLKDIYKAWLEFTIDGAADQSDVFGGQQNIMLATAKTLPKNYLANYQVDPIGKVKIQDTKVTKNTRATCFYGA